MYHCRKGTRSLKSWSLTHHVTISPRKLGCFFNEKKNRSRESAEAAVAFTVKTYGRMDALVNGAAGNFLANAHELKLKVGWSRERVDVRLVDL